MASVRSMKKRVRKLSKSIRQSQRATGRRGYTTDNCSRKQSKLARLKKKIKGRTRRW